MTEKSQEEQTSKNQEGEESQETPQAEEETSNEFKSLEAQKEHFRTKAEKAEQKATELEDKLSQTSQSVPSDPVEVAKLANKLKDYSPEEVEFIQRNAKSNDPKGLMEATDDEWVQAGINAQRQKVEQETNTPAPSSPSSSSSKEFSPKDIGNMSAEEHKKYEEQKLREQRGGSGL